MSVARALRELVDACRYRDPRFRERDYVALIHPDLERRFIMELVATNSFHDTRTLMGFPIVRSRGMDPDTIALVPASLSRHAPLLDS